MQSRIADIQALDARVVAVSVDPPDKSLEVVDGYALDFPILSDPDGEVLDLFGIRHVDGGFEGDIARPATFILDRDGVIQWRNLTDNWRIRVRPEPVLEQLSRLP